MVGMSEAKMQYLSEVFTVIYKELIMDEVVVETASLPWIKQLIRDERAGEIELISIKYKRDKKNLVDGFRVITP